MLIAQSWEYLLKCSQELKWKIKEFIAEIKKQNIIQSLLLFTNSQTREFQQYPWKSTSTEQFYLLQEN